MSPQPAQLLSPHPVLRPWCDISPSSRRQLTEWVLGFLEYDLSTCDPAECLAHEGQRIFRDRLVGDEAQDRFDGE